METKPIEITVSEFELTVCKATMKKIIDSLPPESITAQMMSITLNTLDNVLKPV